MSFLALLSILTRFKAHKENLSNFEIKTVVKLQVEQCQNYLHILIKIAGSLKYAERSPH